MIKDNNVMLNASSKDINFIQNYNFERKSIKKGKNIIEAQIKYIFNDKNKIILSDTISFEYFVK